MKKRQKNMLLFIGTSVLLLGAVTYLYMCTHLEEEDVDFDLYDEDSDVYY